jgi:hypothetical protein
MMTDLDCLGRLERMGVFELMKEAIRLMRQNFYLFLTFVTSFTIPCSIFTVFLLSAIDIHRCYAIDDFISKVGGCSSFLMRLLSELVAFKCCASCHGNDNWDLCGCVQGELVILRWKFETLISPLGLNFVFLILNLLAAALPNTVVCTRGAVTSYKDEDLTTSIKSCYVDLLWAVLRLIATQALMYCFFVIILALYFFPDSSSETPLYVINILRVMRWVFTCSFFVLLYPLPVSQVAILERRNYGLRGVYRAMEVAFSKFLTALGLAFFSLSYFALLKLLVDVLLKDSYPFWTKFLVYPPLVVSVIAMSVFWQVVYTLFYLSSNIHVNLDTVDLTQPGAENRGAETDIHQPLLVSFTMALLWFHP